MRILDKQVGLEKFAGPGGWNDPDMLEVGNGGLTLSENRAYFTLWCLLAAPLMAGNDRARWHPRSVTSSRTRTRLPSTRIRWAAQGRKIRNDGNLEVWGKPLQGGEWAVALLNRGKEAREITVAWVEVGMSAAAAPRVRDLWTKKDHGPVKTLFTATVPSHDVVFVRVTPGT